MASPAVGSLARRASVLAGLAGFCEAAGLGPPVLCRELVEAYCAIGLAGRTSATRGTYRWVLRAAAEHMERRPAVPYAGAAAPPPYAPAERAELWAAVAAERRARIAKAAGVVLTFGIGAGLRPGELARLRAGDVTAADGVVTVQVAGRQVTVQEPLAATAAALAAAAGDGHLLHPGEADRSYKNFVNDLCRLLAARPALSVWRCRSSFLCDRLQAGTPLAVLAGEAGLASVCALRRHAAFVAGMPTTNAGLRQRAAGEAARR
jgi:integrase